MHDHEPEHTASVRSYVVVFAILLALTAVTTVVAFIDLGRLNIVLMLAIAVTKAVIVILFFMHVRYSDRLTAAVVASGFIWLAIMIAFTMSDFAARGVLSGLAG
jgi:cytochrome c oxidase subunit 4